MYWHTPLTLAARFADLMGGVCRVLWQQGPRSREPASVVELVVLRVRRMWTRLTGVSEKMRAGTLLPAKAATRRRVARPRPAVAADRPRLPTRSFGWLIRMVPEPHHLVAWRMPLEELLADPETVAMVGISAQAGRLLRPLCRMLAVDLPEYLQLPARPRRKRPPRPPRVLTPEQRDAKLAKMGRLAYAQVINPEIYGKPNGCRPPNRIGYGRPKPLIKRDPY
jgi:hypothetical protein